MWSKSRWLLKCARLARFEGSMGLFAKLRACFLSKTQAMLPVEPSPERLRIEQLWQSAHIDLSHSNEIMWAVNQTLLHRTRYEHVGLAINVPWYVIAAIHMRESSFNFKTHFSNGDPLFNSDGIPIETVHVPKGLGPYANWETSAIGAIIYKQFQKKHWDLISALDNLEQWNGLGYRNMGLVSPAIWSMTNLYRMGKYSSDGHYDPALVDKQVGCAA